MVATIMTAAMATVKAATMMVAVTTAAIIALAIPIGAMMTTNAAQTQTIRSMAAVMITTMTDIASPFAIMMLIMSMRMTVGGAVIKILPSFAYFIAVKKN